MHFTNEPKCYEIEDKDYFDTLDKRTRLINTCNGDAKVEALLSTWNILKDGQMVKEKEIRFDYNSSAQEKA